MSAMVDQLCCALRRQGCQPEVLRTQGTGDATRFAARASEETRAVVVVGGDGTVREAAEGLVGKGIPLVVLPAGTEDVLAKHLGFRCDARCAAQAVLAGREEAYDTGVCGPRKFLLMIGAGFDGEVARRLSASRRGHVSYRTWTKHGLTVFWRYRFPPLKVEIEGRQVFQGPGMAWAGIIPRYALGARLLHRARTDDELLDVCILPCESRMRVLRYAGRLLFRLPLRGPGIQYHQCRLVRISSADDSVVHFQIDGDYGGTLPVECTVIGAGVRFLRPS